MYDVWCESFVLFSSSVLLYKMSAIFQAQRTGYGFRSLKSCQMVWLLWRVHWFARIEICHFGDSVNSFNCAWFKIYQLMKMIKHIMSFYRHIRGKLAPCLGTIWILNHSTMLNIAVNALIHFLSHWSFVDTKLF